MKKTIVILSAVLALAACSKEPAQTGIDASKLNFNITVNAPNETKGIQTKWEKDNVVYLFFQDCTTDYVKMTCTKGATETARATWAYSNKDGAQDYTKLAEYLVSGKKVTAVYLPKYDASNIDPSFDDGKVKFPAEYNGYFLEDDVEYNVSSNADATDITALLEMSFPANIIQIYIPNDTQIAIEGGGSFVLPSGTNYSISATNLCPFSIAEFVPGTAPTITKGTVEFPLAHVDAVIGGETGKYFWGVLNESDTQNRDYIFDLVTLDDNGCAVKTYSKLVEGKKLDSSKAFKLTGPFNDYGPFIDMGDGVFWATGNITRVSNSADPRVTRYNHKIAGPYEFADLIPVSQIAVGPNTPYSDPVRDIAYLIHNVDYQGVEVSWTIPTIEQYQSLLDITTQEYVVGRNEVGSADIGGFVFTSKINGNKLYFMDGRACIGVGVGNVGVGKDAKIVDYTSKTTATGKNKHHFTVTLYSEMDFTEGSPVTIVLHTDNNPDNTSGSCFSFMRPVLTNYDDWYHPKN